MCLETIPSFSTHKIYVPTSQLIKDTNFADHKHN